MSTIQCLRVYPKGTRFDSSNYSPIPSWSSGCQLVSLNYQTPGIIFKINIFKLIFLFICSGEPMWLNTGTFLNNGGCGYVLKPATLLKPNSTCRPLKFSIKVYIIIIILIALLTFYTVN